MEELLKRLSEKTSQFKSTYAEYKQGSGNFEHLNIIVREIEEIQKDFEIKSGLAEAKKNIHDISIHIPTLTDRQGSFNAEALLNFITQINTIMDTATPGVRSIMEYNIVGISPGSSTLLGDFNSIKEISDPTIEGIILEAKQSLQNVISSASSFSKPGLISEKVEVFKNSTGLSIEKAYEISKAVTKLHPEPSELLDNVEVQINTPETQTASSFTKNERLNAIKTKREIYAKIKPEEEFVLTGKLGIMEEWDTNHKISIIDTDTHKITTLHYEPTDQNIRIIKSKIGRDVTIQRMRDPEDKRRWVLEDWID